jgi:hypothetical protein
MLDLKISITITNNATIFLKILFIKFKFCMKKLLFSTESIQEVSEFLLPYCAAIYYSSATRPLKLINGCQGHPPFLPVAWARLAATEPGRETVERATLYSADICSQL